MPCVQSELVFHLVLDANTLLRKERWSRATFRQWAAARTPQAVTPQSQPRNIGGHLPPIVDDLHARVGPLASWIRASLLGDSGLSPGCTRDSSESRASRRAPRWIQASRRAARESRASRRAARWIRASRRAARESRASCRATCETPARVGPVAGLRAGFGPLARGFRPVAGLHARVGPVAGLRAGFGPVAGLRAGFGPVAGLQPVRRGQ